MIKNLLHKTRFVLLVLIACTILAFTVEKVSQPNRVVVPTERTSTQDVIDAINAFKATLSASQVSSCFLTYSLTDAVKWSNLPIGLYRNRVGIALAGLSATQLAAAKQILKLAAGPGSEGYAEIEGILAADTYLGANGGGSDYSAGNYYLAILGAPSLSNTWELYFGGHHLAFANTYKNGALAGGTPSFRAVEPFAAFTQNGLTFQPLIEEKNAFAAIHSSLSSTQLTTATISGTFNDIVLGAQKDWQFPTAKTGLLCSSLSAAQKALVLAAIKTYVADIDSVNANAIMTKYTSEIDQTYLAFKGSGTMVTQGDYIRIDGPSVWIEYSAQGGIVFRNITHPHSVWRDRTSDYGGTGNTTSVKVVKATVFKMDNFPNPATDQTTLKFDLPEDMTVKIAIYDQNGRIVKAVAKGKMLRGQHNLAVDLTQLVPGVYSYMLETEFGERASKYLVKQ